MSRSRTAHDPDDPMGSSGVNVSPITTNHCGAYSFGDADLDSGGLSIYKLRLVFRPSSTPGVCGGRKEVWRHVRCGLGPYSRAAQLLPGRPDGQPGLSLSQTGQLVGPALLPSSWTNPPSLVGSVKVLDVST